MTRKLVWFEAVDLDDCAFDTNDISTIRGGSLAMLDAGRLLGEHLRNLLGRAESLIFAGASQALFDVPEADLPRVLAEIEAFVTDASPALAGYDPPFPASALRFVVGVVDAVDADPVRSMRRAHAAARWAQTNGGAGLPIDEARRATLPPGMAAYAWRGPVEVTAEAPCSIDHRRPADATIAMKRDRAADLRVAAARNAPESQKTVDVPVSGSVAARRRWGLEMRQAFYGREANEWWSRRGDFLSSGQTDPKSFVFDFQEMVDGLPAVRLPVSLDNKIAVFYADGNGFGKILAGARILEDVTRFSKDARRLMKRLLSAVLERVTAIAADEASDGIGAPMPPEAGAFFEAREPPRLRFESLLYGGDELCWVFPAWIALDLMSAIFDAVDGETIDGQPASFSCGLVIADRKMPIADLRDLAYEAASFAKIHEKEPKTRVSIHVFESIEPPSGGLEAHLARLVGTGEDVKRFLALDRADFDRVVDWIRHRKEVGAPPRSQIVRILADAQRGGIEDTDEPRRLGSTARSSEGAVTADARVVESWAHYARRADGGTGPLGPLLQDPTPMRDAAGEIVGRTQAPALELWLAAQLWDYVDPFARGAVQ